MAQDVSTTVMKEIGSVFKVLCSLPGSEVPPSISRLIFFLPLIKEVCLNPATSL